MVFWQHYFYIFFSKAKYIVKSKAFLFISFFITIHSLHAKNDTLQTKKTTNVINNRAGWFSLGVRSTMNVFSDDGFGVGAGGQFRLQLTNRVNTDWFADYISVNHHGIARSEYIHIGWSVLFYPVKQLQYPKYKAQPFILAGHCFDYNKMTIYSDPSISKHRWGAAVQMGLGSHFHLSERLDITLMMQYMMHLTKELHPEKKDDVTYEIVAVKGSALEGHLLCTVSLNYKIVKLWKK